MNGAVDTHAVEAQNKVIIEDAFTVWLAGTGSPFDLLAEDATWTIVGRSTVAKAAALAIGRFPAPHASPRRPCAPLQPVDNPRQAAQWHAPADAATPLDFRQVA